MGPYISKVLRAHKAMLYNYSSPKKKKEEREEKKN